MRRTVNVEPENDALTLDELIPIYAINKIECDSYTKICKEQNELIKKEMLGKEEREHISGNYVAKCVVSERTSLDEAKILAVAKKFNIPGIIKTKEYVDTDELENYLYHNEASQELASAIANCYNVKEVVTLTVKQSKKKEN